MPEIKNTFTGGRMNKDLDERLLSNGEYRDAMNIQVSTSEGSHVGAVQNILGNEMIDPADQATIPANAICIGSIADEKNDSLYWFVNGEPFQLSLLDDPGSNITSLTIANSINNKGQRYFFKDMIIRHGDSSLLLNIEPVFVDAYALLTMFDPNSYTTTGYPPTGVSLFSFKLESLKGIIPNMLVSYIDEFGNNYFPAGTIITAINAATNLVTISNPVVMNSWPLGYLRFEGERVLNFNRDLIITGINIIDDLLFWTSNNDEPKKINISTSIAGTKNFFGQSSGDYHTRLIVPERGIQFSQSVPVLKKHITVIKKSPSSPPRLKPLASRSGTIWGTSSFDFNGKETSDSIIFTMASFPLGQELNYRKGDIILLQDYPGLAVAASIFPIDEGEYDIRLLVDHVIDPANSIFNCTILSISDDANTATNAEYIVDLDQTGKKLFNLKFPRFSLRYKYKDGEYSSFGPWSDIAFIPKDPPEFAPKWGYNLGMENQLVELTINNIVTADIPEDVIQVDLLYKETNSPNIYLVDKIKSDDPIPTNMFFNNWYSDKYFIDSETIHAVLPVNQFLRPWDNVPRMALAQEIIGNRIIYGNYLQNYDLINDSGQQIVPEFNISLSQYRNNPASYSTIPKIWKSVKSMREYQMGIVYRDEFGRETPVLTAPSGTFKVSKLSADKHTNIAVEMSSLPPAWAKSFRYYIKETSSEYYNLAMDRWYDAQDGNIWLSFPSSDRNKLDIDNHIILKKVHNSQKLITENARYRVLAIENEAPDFIKTKKKNLGRIDNFDSTTIRPLGDPSVLSEKFPMQGNFGFQIRAYAIDALSPASNTAGYQTTGDSFALKDYFPGKDQSNDAAGKTLPLGAPPMLVRFINVGADGLFIDEASDWYEISGIAKDVSDNYDAGTAGHDADPTVGDITASDVYEIELNKPFGTDVNWMIHDLTATVLEQMKDNGTIRMEIVQEIVENKPEFDGRFFVKIERDQVIDETIIATSFFDGFSKKSSVLLSYVKDFTEHDPGIEISNYPTGNGNYGGTTGTLTLDASLHALAIQDFSNDQMGSGSSVLARAGAWDTSGGQFALGNVPAGTQVQSGWNIPDPPANSRQWGKPVPLDSYWSWHIWHHIWRQCNPGSGNPAAPRSWGLWASGPYYATINSHPSKWFIDEAFFVCEDDQWISTVGSSSGINYARSNSIRVPGAIQWISPMFWGTMGGGVGNADVSVRMPSKYAGWGKDFTTLLWTSQMQKDPSIVPSGTAGSNVSKFFEYHGKGQGINGRTIDISYIGPGDSNKHKPKTGGWVDTSSNDMCDYGDMWRVGDVQAGPQSAEARSFIADCTPGAYCRFSNNPSKIYRVKSVIQRYLSNYSEHQYDGHYPLAHLHDRNVEWPVDCDGSGNVGAQAIPDEFPQYQNIDNPYQWSGCNDSSPSVTKAALEAFWRQPWNRRLMLRITLDDDIVQPDYNPIDGGWVSGTNYTRNVFPGEDFQKPPHEFEMLEGYFLDDSDANQMSEDPAIWETEPREDIDLDIFYEVGQTFPIKLEESNWKALAGFINSTVYIFRPANSPWVLNNNSSHPNFPNSIPTGNIIPMHVNWSLTSMVVTSVDNKTITVSSKSGLSYANNLDYPNEHIVPGDILYLTLDDGSAIGVEVESTNSQHTGTYFSDGIGTVIPSTSAQNNIITLNSSISSNRQLLPYHNCYAFENGVESDRIRDDFNQITIGKGVKASSTIEEKYEQEHRKYGLIYSGLYNSTSGINDLNQFIMAEKITKDINPTYGSIQKLFSRDTDLVTLCEDKCLRILANKDAVYNADGNMQLTATNNVLGQTIPFKGEYGISKNPESFATEAFRMYFTDKQRGAVMRLSMDGLTPISDHGMHDWFRDYLKDNDTLIGGYDDYKREYNLTLPQTQKTISFREDVRGWVSFKSFLPQNSLSAVNKYYSFDKGKIYQHHIENMDRNTFYNVFMSSYIEVLLNTSSEIVKSFNTLHYEGSQSRVDQFWEYLNPRDGVTYKDNDYHNLGLPGTLPNRDGWYVEHISTDMQDGTFKEFIEKEGKWFNFIRGSEIPISDDGTIIAPLNNQTYDSSEFSWQGIGRAGGVSAAALKGCMDINAVNFDCATILHPSPWPTSCSDGVSIDDGTCVMPSGFVMGCMNPNATNYDPIATYEDFSCLVEGCIDPTMFNFCGVYDPVNYTGCNVMDGSCIPIIYGCTQSTMYNFCSTANTPCGLTIQNAVFGCDCTTCTGPGNNECCVYNVPGCMDQTAFNYNPLANVDDMTCIPGIIGCMNPNMTNYNILANTACSNCCSFNCPTWGEFYPIYPAGLGNGGRLLIIVNGYYPGVPANAEYTMIVTAPGGLQWTVGPTPLSLAPQMPHYVPFIYMQDPGNFEASITFSWPGGETNGETCTYDTSTAVSSVGCNDGIASNYTPVSGMANDGSCQYCAIPGCMDGPGNAANNDPNYVPGTLNPVHGSLIDCTTITSPTANNYSNIAECNDPGNPCQYWGCRTPSSISYSPCYDRDCGGGQYVFGDTGYDGSCCIYVGCTSNASGCYPALDYQPFGSNPQIIGRCQGIIPGSSPPTNECTPYQPCCGPNNGYAFPLFSGQFTTNIDPITGTVASCGLEIVGCLDPSADNTNDCATIGCGPCGSPTTCCTGC